MRKVPALFDPDNNFRMGQSHAIMNYLIRKFKLQHKWGYQNQVQRAKIDQYLHYHHQNTRKCAGIIYNQVYSKLNPVETINLPQGPNLRSQIKQCFDFINNHYFQQSYFMIGKSLTPSDLSAYFQIQSLVVIDYDLSPWKKITKWIQQLSKLQYIKQANQNFLKFVPRMKNPKPKI